eukprot:276294-Hanusia_phi.AAC.1
MSPGPDSEKTEPLPLRVWQGGVQSCPGSVGPSSRPGALDLSVSDRVTAVRRLHCQEQLLVASLSSLQARAR